MTFTDFDSESFDLVYSRHSLEHSPFPLLTLMEWHRIAKHWLLVILPNPEHYGWAGKNHYGVMNWEQAEYFLDRSGWKVIWDDKSEPSEIRLMCAKVKKSWV
jgi:SAM-dependent methyltransferase